MSQERLAPQQPADCLIQSRKSSCKGGTLIAAEVWTLEEHRQQLGERYASYRGLVGGCPTCGWAKLHVHDYRERKVLQALLVVVVTVVRFICVNPQCGATWQLLPAFVARHLWWRWRTVEQETAAEAAGCTPEHSPSATPLEVAPSSGMAIDRVPSTRTRQRWLERLRASAAQLVQLMASGVGKTVQAAMRALQGDSTRAELVQWYGQAMGIARGRRYAAVAALVHDLERGIRLM
jgi:hypothetical protein